MYQEHQRVCVFIEIAHISGFHTVILNAFSSNSRKSSHTAHSSQLISPEQSKPISVSLKMAQNIIKALFSQLPEHFSLSSSCLGSGPEVGGVIKGTGTLAWSHSEDAYIGL